MDKINRIRTQGTFISFTYKWVNIQHPKSTPLIKSPTFLECLIILSNPRFKHIKAVILFNKPQESTTWGWAYQQKKLVLIQINNAVGFLFKVDTLSHFKLNVVTDSITNVTLCLIFIFYSFNIRYQYQRHIYCIVWEMSRHIHDFYYSRFFDVVVLLCVGNSLLATEVNLAIPKIGSVKVMPKTTFFSQILPVKHRVIPKINICFHTLLLVRVSIQCFHLHLN